ncbi:MAG: cytochrome c maturation protein CcmE [Armatimonadetes bacterium]|nr:cytochrome c maturation protein CcmE [Armatimonadota bacterium]
MIVSILCIAGSAGLGLSAFQKSLTPYVSFREAKAAGTSVQVSGEVLLAQVAYDPRSGTLRFPLKDHSGEVMNVVYEGGKPNNFEQAEQVVAIGRCENGTFRAESLLTKCPSKYEAEPGKEGPANKAGKPGASGDGTEALLKGAFNDSPGYGSPSGGR